MTTTVTVTTHDWPARVSGFPAKNGQPDPEGEWTVLDTVPPNSSRTFYPHADQDVLVQELPKPD